MNTLTTLSILGAFISLLFLVVLIWAFILKIQIKKEMDRMVDHADIEFDAGNMSLEHYLKIHALSNRIF